MSEESASEHCQLWLEDRGEHVSPIPMCMNLDGKEVVMGLDTGASVSLICLRICTTTREGPR